MMELPKGTRDFMPEDKILRDDIVKTLKKNFELFGYNPLETPALEMYETLASKYAGGGEILKETYSLKDNADRKLGLRYDLTVPFARVIAMNPQLKMPFKRYQIDKVWRDGPIKLGRYREFWQCDCDVVGSSSMIADAELIALASKVFDDLDLEVTLYFNNRKLLNSILDYCGIKKSVQDDAIISIDKLKKIGFDGVKKELVEKGIADDNVEKIKEVFGTDGSNLENLKSILKNKEGLEEIEKLMNYLKEFKVSGAQLDISLARGLAYYTGTVYEVFLKSSEISSSLAAGGRYDNMIGLLAGKKENVPAIGISFGLDVISDAIKMIKKEKSRKTVVKVFIIPIKAENESVKLLSDLRNSGVNADMDLIGRGISKNLNYANQFGIPFVIIIGEDEIKKGKFKLRDMSSGEEKDLGKEELINFLSES